VGDTIFESVKRIISEETFKILDRDVIEKTAKKIIEVVKHEVEEYEKSRINYELRHNG